MTELADPIRGTYNGKEVELIPQWKAQSTGLFGGFKGSISSHYGSNHFAAQTFTVSGTGETVTSGSESANLFVCVYALSANQQTLPESTKTVKKSDIMDLSDGDTNWPSTLDLPGTAQINYTPATIQSWQDPGGSLPTNTYTITGWQDGNGYYAQDITVQALKAKINESGNGNVILKLYPVYAKDTIPEWATENSSMRPVFTLIIVDNDPATVKVTTPQDITYGDVLDDPTATATDGSGNPVEGTFTYLYTGAYKSGEYGGTTNYSSETKPTRAGTYKVTATFTSGTYSGVGYSDEFTISPKEVSIEGEITAKDKEYNNSSSAGIDFSKASIDGVVAGDDLYIDGSGQFEKKDVGNNLSVTIRYWLSGSAKYNYTLKDSDSNGQITINDTASITRQKVAIDDSKITVAKGHDGTTSPGKLGGKLGLHYDYYNIEIDQSNVTVGNYADAEVGKNKTVTLSGIKLSDNGVSATNYELTTEDGTPLTRTGVEENETYSYEFKRAEITAKKWPVLGTDFTVVFPENPTYNENPWEVTVTPTADGTGLGTATVTYAKWENNGGTHNYWEPLADGEKPTNAGKYKVTVSFAEGDNFAAMEGNNAFELKDYLVIGKATERTLAVNIIVPDKPGEEQTVYLSGIGLPETVTAGNPNGAFVKNQVAVDDRGGVLASAKGPVNAHYIDVTTKSDAAGKSQTLNLVLYSDNYETLKVTAAISVGSVQITNVPLTGSSFVYGTQLQAIVDQANLLSQASVKLNGTPVQATSIWLMDQGKVYDAGTYANKPIGFTCRIAGREYTVQVPITFTINKRVLGSGDLNYQEYYYTIYANNPANESENALVEFLKDKQPNYRTNISIQEPDSPPTQLFLNAVSWTKDTTVDNTDFNPKGTRLPTGVYAWYTYNPSLSLDSKYQTNYAISPDLEAKAYIKVLPAYAKQTLAVTSKETTTTEIVLLKEDSWKTKLGLPDKVTVAYNGPPNIGSDILQAAGSLKEPSTEYTITKWLMDDKTEITFDFLQEMAKNAIGNQEIKLTPVYDNAPIWATLEEAPVFTLKVTLDGIPSVVVKEPYVFEYGTSLGDIIAVRGTGVSLANSSDGEEILSAGVYSDKTITLKAKKEGMPEETIEVPIPTFTIVPATIKSFDSESSAYVQYGYWKTIYANDKNNSETALVDLLPKSYTTDYYSNGEKIKLTANWSLDDNSCPYEPKGYTDNMWYSFTAHLTLPDGLDPKNFNISIEPKGYIRVMPANAYQTINPVSKAVSKSTVNGLTNLNGLGLPTLAAIIYKHSTETPAAAAAFTLAEQSGDTFGALEESTAAAYMAAGASPSTAYRLAREATESEETETEITSGKYAITGWLMDGAEFTLEKLKEKANEVTGGKPMEITLTPVYDAKSIPAWATLLEKPTFTLVITSDENGVPGDVTVTAPSIPDSEITYGMKLPDPKITGISVDKVTVTYEGMYGTEYNSSDKPAKAGTYRVVVALKDNPSVRWASSVFQISRKEVQIKGIECDLAGRPYDGTTNANSVLDASNATIDGLIDGDQVSVTNPIGYFSEDKGDDGKYIKGSGKNVKDEKIVVLIGATLTGTDAGNYVLGPFFKVDDKGNQTPLYPTYTSAITPRPLSIDDSGLMVTKAQSENEWKWSGELKLENVIGSEVSLNMSGVQVSSTENTVGTNKTVTLTGIKLITGKEDLNNYSPPGELKKAEDGTDTYTYTFQKAEITAMPRPKLDTDFTVTIPAAAAYDGNPREAVYTPKAGTTGLGKATVTYAKRLADGTYADPTANKPVNAGTYKVLASFAKGASFDAAEGQNAVAAGTLIINKAESTAHTKAITVPAFAVQTVLLSELGLSDAVAQGIKIKIAPSVAGSEILESVTGAVGRDFFTLKTQKVENTKSGNFTITLTSDNYETVTVTINITVDTGALSITPPWVTLQSEGYFAGDTALKDILVLTGGSASLMGEPVEGTFALKEPNKICKPGTYTNHPFEVVFTSSNGSRTGTATVRVSFVIHEGEGGGSGGGPSSISAVVAVTPPHNITFGQTLETPSATAAVGGSLLSNASFTFIYEGINGTVYSENTIPPTDAGTYRVTAVLANEGYSGKGSAEFTIAKAESASTEAYILINAGSEKTIKIDETFILSYMAKGAKIKTAPTIAAGGKLLQSCTAPAGASEFTLKSKSDAPNGSTQQFSLVLTSDNYETVTVMVTVYNDNVVIAGLKLKEGKTEFESGTACKDIIDLTGCTATVNGTAVPGSFALLEPELKVTGPNTYDNWPIVVCFTTADGTKYQVTVYAPSFTVKASGGSTPGEIIPPVPPQVVDPPGGTVTPVPPKGDGGKTETPVPPKEDIPPDKVETTVETKEDGTIVTTVKDNQGTVIVTEKKPDNSVTTTVRYENGCSSTIETDPAGKTVAVVDVPAGIAGAATGSGDAVLLPVVGIWAHKDIDKAPAMVVNTFGVNGVKVRVPVENMSLSVVAVEIKSDGTPVIIKNTIPTEDGIMFRMDHLGVVRFLDNSKPFTDVLGHWAADAITFVTARELFQGTAPDTFSPDAGMTRAMLLTVLARYADEDTAGGAAWYEKSVTWAKSIGLSDGTRLNDNITREQLVTILYRYAKFQGKLSGEGAGLDGYTDADRVSEWAVDAMSWAVSVGLVKGSEQAALDPQSNATRAQVAAIMMRYVEMFGL